MPNQELLLLEPLLLQEAESLQEEVSPLRGVEPPMLIQMVLPLVSLRLQEAESLQQAVLLLLLLLSMVPPLLSQAA